MARVNILALLVAIVVGLSGTGAAAQTATITERLKFDTNPHPTVKPATVEATLYLPRASGPVPAMVIISSSGGVLDWIEGYYARELNKAGIGALVVDSFKPRGVKRVVEDQSLVTSWDMENDAFAALAELLKDKRIDPLHIGIMGLSKGGSVAQNSAFMVRRSWRRTGDLAFAAHVAIGPDCASQHRTAKTTGKPIFYMLGDLDDYNIAKLCVAYAERIKQAGNSDVALKMYKGAHHNWEDTHAVILLGKAENYAKCDTIIEDDGAMAMASGKGPTFMKGSDIFAWRRANCMTMGAHVAGGTEKLKREATGDLVAFLKRQGF